MKKLRPTVVTRSPGHPSRTRMLALVDRLAGTTVTVLGDVVLDEFEYGEIARISREAPVLILEHSRTDLCPGGAANAAANLAAVDVQVRLVGRIGNDPQGERLARLLTARGVDLSGLVPDRSFPTPTKTRTLAGGPHTRKQQIVRMDRGRRGVPLPERIAQRLIRYAGRARSRGEALLLADYGYGSVEPDWVPLFPKSTAPLTLDSRFSLPRFRGVDAATPNLEEVERAVGKKLPDDDEAAINAAARALQRRLQAQALLVTRGARGMSLAAEPKAVERIPVFGSDEVADVTGAGDTVIALFTATRTAGGTWREAAELANVAGGLVVMKSGTATVSRAELRATIADHWID